MNCFFSLLHVIITFIGVTRGLLGVFTGHVFKGGKSHLKSLGLIDAPNELFLQRSKLFGLASSFLRRASCSSPAATTSSSDRAAFSTDRSKSAPSVANSSRRFVTLSSA